MVENPHYHKPTSAETDIPPSQEGHFFDTLSVGYFTPGQVVVDTPYYSTTPLSLVEIIGKDWLRRGSPQRSLRRTATLVQNPAIINDNVHLPLGRSNFAAFQATRDPQIRTEYEDHMHKIDPIRASVLVVTQDEQLLLAPMSPKHPTKALAMSVISGYPEVTEDLNRPDKLLDLDENGKWDPFKTIIRELHEEAGIHPIELQAKDTALTGIIFNKSSNQPVVTFVAKTWLHSSDIRQRVADGKTDGEVGIRFAPSTQEAFEALLLTYPSTPSPSGTASLLFYGKQLFGNEWYEWMQLRLQNM